MQRLTNATNNADKRKTGAVDAGSICQSETVSPRPRSQPNLLTPPVCLKVILHTLYREIKPSHTGVGGYQFALEYGHRGHCRSLTCCVCCYMDERSESCCCFSLRFVCWFLVFCGVLRRLRGVWVWWGVWWVSEFSCFCVGLLRCTRCPTCPRCLSKRFCFG